MILFFTTNDHYFLIEAIKYSLIWSMFYKLILHIK